MSILTEIEEVYSTDVGTIFDASELDPADWEELEAVLDEAYRFTRRAVEAGTSFVYLVHEPSIWGHATPLRSALATALLGGMRSAAVELQRRGLTANAVAFGDPADGLEERVERAVAFLLLGDLTGQVVTLGTTHLGRPVA